MLKSCTFYIRTLALKKRINIASSVKCIKMSSFSCETSEFGESNESTVSLCNISGIERIVKAAEGMLFTLQKELKNLKQQIALAKAKTPQTNRTVISEKRSHSTDSTDNNTKNKKIKLDLTMENDYVVVYTDGACQNNGKSNAKAGIGVWFGDNHPLNASEPVRGKATNNNAEIQACTTALQLANDNGVRKLKIVTDSEFVIKSMTQWVKNWQRNNWKTASGTDVKNKDEFMKLLDGIKLMDDVQWEHVRGHRGVKGNEEADKLARNGATRYM